MLLMSNWQNEFDERYPIYQQIMNQFFRAIVKEELKPGDRIPSIRDLALLLKVNANTIQRAYQEMERQRIIYSQRGTGYFVMEDQNMIGSIKKEMIQSSASHFFQEMRALGLTDEQIMKEVELFINGGGEVLCN